MRNQLINKFIINRQKRLFSTASKGIIVLFNFNTACVMAYGQTSSGKTYTMKGT